YQLRRLRSSPRFPYTTLFRSAQEAAQPPDLRLGSGGELPVRERPRPFSREGTAVALQHLRGVVLRIEADREQVGALLEGGLGGQDRKSTRLNSSHEWISYAVL